MIITVITPARNSAATIRDTLESVRSQRYPAIEHIVVDALSTDSTAECVRHYPHVADFIHEPDRGIYDAMNKGLRRATGDVVGFLNSDDVFADDRVLERIAETFQSTSCDATYGDLLYTDRETMRKSLRHWQAGPYRSGAFLRGWMPPHPTFYAKRALYGQHGDYRLSLGLAADYELMLRFIHKHQIVLEYIPKVLVHMRAGGASNRTWLQRLAAHRNDYKAWQVNGLSPRWFTLTAKPLRKILQFAPMRKMLWQPALGFDGARIG